MLEIMRITLLANPDSLHVRRWVEFLAGRGHTLTMVTDPFTRYRPPECRVLVPHWTPWTNLLAFRLTPRPYGNDRWKHLLYRPLVRESKPDVVHGMEAFNYGLATALCGPYPKVLTPWGKDVHHDADASWIAGRMIRRALHGVDVISTNDETMGEHLARRFGLNPERVRAFSWGVDLDVFNPGQQFLARRWQRDLEIPKGATIILSPRNFIPHWGSELLMDAIPKVLRERPEALFIILRGAAGQAETLAAAQRRAEAEGYAHALRFIDRTLTNTEMAGFFNLADLFVSVPKTDLLSQTILEGMACGCLPILSDQPAYYKHIRPGQNGLVLKEYAAEALAGAILEGIGDKALRQRAYTENPSLIAQHENWYVNALKIEDVYVEAIHHFRGRK